MDKIKIALEKKLEEINSQIAKDNKFEEIGQSESDATQEYENLAQNQAMLKSLEKDKKEIIATLKRIDNGTYGKCKSCKGNIEQGRLRAFPTADRCAQCASKR